MTIKVGDKIPSIALQVMGAEGPQAVTTDGLLAGKKVVLFAVPGAYTPGCSNTHMPGFVIHADKIKAKGVDDIICTSVNDVFVMAAWGRDQNAEHITMLADGNGELAEALGLTLDLTGAKLGVRSKRYAMIVNDGVVELLNVDDKGIEKSSAETILEAL
ncbi:MAG: peroxiredoxin [Gammaproteobacteria bacterium]|uniref:peroxiredoxin n=1 Tax=Pseudomaricurvus alcaniphilus TaxID=1166482 RepID=UPI00140D6FDA|nr:peroxiredoxin [Pseudomaricurvus alcaniphilus]MBR9912232.1 peroxiredoxin [Gammaproteobacteria bacterium]NHN38704.1 peroxiredoxin [Pseudomaricurvus alcaniphilus]